VAVETIEKQRVESVEEIVVSKEDIFGNKFYTSVVLSD
jgi:hypothetical protein